MLKRLQLSRAIPSGQFRESMTRRFAVFSRAFLVHLNGLELAREEMDLEFRFPDGNSLNAEEIAGIGQVRWWAGFAPSPIKSEPARGITVLAKGKLAQEPFFFKLTGGLEGQHGMQYMTGEVWCDYLDDEVDLIATDRASVRWEDPRAQPLLLWGQEKVRELLRTWATRRSQKRIERLSRATPHMSRIGRFPPRERQELTQAINRLASIETIEDVRLAELVDFLIKAYENEHFMALIRALNATDENAKDEIFRLVAEWDVLEAIHTAQLVRGRVEIIRKFRAMIEARVPEKPDLQDFLKPHPWLINVAWQVLQHERSLEKVLLSQFPDAVEAAAADMEGGSRLDFFCIGDSLRKVVVEVKRPGVRIGRDEIRRLEDYVDYLRRWAQGTNEPIRTAQIEGVLIYSDIAEDALEMIDRLRQHGIYIRTWEDLLYQAESLHREFLDVVKMRAPRDDPRIQALEANDPLLAAPVAPRRQETR